MDRKFDRIIINDNNIFKNLRFDRENFSFSEKEKNVIIQELDKLEAMLAKKNHAVFSISKYDDLFSASLKLDSDNLFAYSKDPCAATLFYKLLGRIEKNILDDKRIQAS